MENFTLKDLIIYLNEIDCPPHVLEDWYFALKEGKKLEISGKLPEGVTCYMKYGKEYFFVR